MGNFMRGWGWAPGPGSRAAEGPAQGNSALARTYCTSRGGRQRGLLLPAGPPEWRWCTGLSWSLQERQWVHSLVTWFPRLSNFMHYCYGVFYQGIIHLNGASLIAQLVKNPPAMWEIWVRSLGWEDPLEKGKATHLSILAWRIPWTT